MRSALPGLLTSVLLARFALLVPGPASPLAVALVSGVALANVRPLPTVLEPGLHVAATSAMRPGVVLLGLSVTADAVVSLGWPVLLVVLGPVLATLLAVVGLGRSLGVRAPPPCSSAPAPPAAARRRSPRSRRSPRPGGRRSPTRSAGHPLRHAPSSLRRRARRCWPWGWSGWAVPSTLRRCAGSACGPSSSAWSAGSCCGRWNPARRARGRAVVTTTSPRSAAQGCSAAAPGGQALLDDSMPLATSRAAALRRRPDQTSRLRQADADGARVARLAGHRSAPGGRPPAQDRWTRPAGCPARVRSAVRRQRSTMHPSSPSWVVVIPFAADEGKP